ncbi:hypothetical protein HHI36_010501 [Cryptolaemus montrouzieri]|uniref:Uncharacterized protein n=1 Tax=Cryptolaemus montrouzieri TaxID=559131 RepID=A0ABD2MIZ2_9CUCU
MGNTRANKAWKIIKGLRTNNSDTENISPIGMNDWVKYYKGLLTEDRPKFQQEQNFRSTEETQEIENISSMEVKEAVKYMKNGKSSGAGNLNIELVKAAPDALIEWIVVLFYLCLKGQKLPEE